MNNFAISSTGIGEALKRSAAALAAGGNTIDESIALITAANNVVQNPDAVGTAMKTYSMYLRAAKAEAEAAGESTDGMANSVSKLRGELMTLTGGRVDIMENDTTFKSTYQVTKELSQIWDTVSDIDRAAILEKIGGKRNANTLSGLITNFAEAEKVLETSLNSAGSAVQENEKYLDSIAGKTAQLKAAFEDLSTSFLSSDIFKGFIDGGTKVIEILDFIIDKIGGVATVIAGIGIAKTISGISTAVKAAGGIGNMLSALSGKDGELVQLAAQSSIVGGIASKFSAVGVAIGGAAAAISAVSTTIKNINENISKRQADASKAAEQYQQVADSLVEYKQRVTELRTELQSLGLSDDMAQSKRAELVDIENQLADAFGREAGSLDLINGVLDTQISMIDKLSEKSFASFKNENRSAINMAEDYLADLSGLDVWNRTFGPLKEVLSDNIMGVAGSVLDTDFRKEVFSEFEKRYGKSIFKLSGTTALGAANNYGVEVKNAFEMQEYLEGLLNITEDLGRAKYGGNYKDKIGSVLSSYSDQLREVNRTIENNKEVFETYAEGELYTNPEYKLKWSELITARKEYDDAILSGDEKLQEQLYRNINEIYKGFDISDIKDKSVSTYLEQYFKDFGKENIEIGAKIDIKSDLSESKSDLNKAIDESLRSFLDAEGRIDEALLKAGKIDFENGIATSGAKAYEKLSSAAEQYGLKVEQLISTLTQLGVVHESALNEAYKNARTNFAEIINNIHDAYTGYGIDSLVPAVYKYAESSIGTSKAIVESKRRQLAEARIDEMMNYSKSLPDQISTSKLSKTVSDFIGAVAEKVSDMPMPAKSLSGSLRTFDEIMWAYSGDKVSGKQLPEQVSVSQLYQAMSTIIKNVTSGLFTGQDSPSSQMFSEIMDTFGKKGSSVDNIPGRTLLEIIQEFGKNVSKESGDEKTSVIATTQLGASMQKFFDKWISSLPEKTPRLSESQLEAAALERLGLLPGKDEEPLISWDSIREQLMSSDGKSLYLPNNQMEIAGLNILGLPQGINNGEINTPVQINAQQIEEDSAKASKAIGEIGESAKETGELLYDLGNGNLYSFQEIEQLAKQAGQSINEFVKTEQIENNIARLKDVFYELAGSVDISSGIIDDKFAANVQNTVAFVASALDAFTAQADNVAASTEVINAAIAEQQEVGSVTAETYEKLVALGDDYSNILEWNGRAISVNSDAVEKLNHDLHDMTEREAMAAQEASIDTWNLYADIIKQMSSSYSTLTDSEKEFLDSLIASNRELTNRITGFQLLISQMDFANSGYKKWLDAGSKTDTDKMYSDAVNAYQATQEVFGYTDKSSGKWVKGNRKINSIAFNAATEFLVPENIRKQGLPAIQKYLNGIQKYMRDDQKSVEEFLRSAKGAGLMDEENGMWSVKEGKTTEDFIRDLNITKDLFTSLVGDANVYGVEFKFDDENQILALNDAQDYFEAQNEYNKAVEKWNKTAKENTVIDEKTGKAVVKQTKEVTDAQKELEEAATKKNEEFADMMNYSDATLKNVGVTFKDGQTKEDAVREWFGGENRELEVDVAYNAKKPKGNVQKLIQQYRENYAAMLENPNNTEAINSVQQIATQLESLPKNVQVAFGIDTTLFDSGIASISETINDLISANNEYQVAIETGATEEELDGLKGKVDDIVTALNGLPPEKLVEIGFTGDVLTDGKIDTDKLLAGLSDGSFSLDNLNLGVSLGDSDGIEGTLATLEQIQGKIDEIRGMGDLIIVADIFIDEAMARIGDLKADFDSIKNLRAAPTVVLSAPNVLFLIGEIKSTLAEISGSEHNATVTATVMQAALALSGIIGQIGSIEGDHSLSVTASTSQAVSAIGSVQSALDGLHDKTVTVTVNTVNTGGGGGSGVNGSAFAGGDWGVKRGGISLVGELGREIIVDPNDGTWHTVGDYGAEFANIPQGAIVFNHKQTEALLKYGKVAGRGKALAGGTAMMTGGGSLWKPTSTSTSSGRYSAASSSISSSDVQEIAEATKEGVEEGVETAVSGNGVSPWDLTKNYLHGSPIDRTSREGELVGGIYHQYSGKWQGNEYKTVGYTTSGKPAGENKINERLIKYLLDNNFGFTEEELQAILDEAHERYGSDHAEYGRKLRAPTADSLNYAFWEYNMKKKYSDLYDYFEMSDPVYSKEMLRSIIEKFFESIAKGSEVNFESVDAFKSAVSKVLNDPNYLTEAIGNRLVEKADADSYIASNHITGEAAEQKYKNLLGAYYDSDNTDLWGDVLAGKLDELFSGDWYDNLIKTDAVLLSDSDLISSGIEDLIETFFDRLERRIDKVDSIVSSSFKNIENRTSASYDKIDLLTKELSDKQKAADIYLEAADAINISDNIKKAIQDGDLRIEDLRGSLKVEEGGKYHTAIVDKKSGGTGGVISMIEPKGDAEKDSVFKDNVSKYQDFYEKYLDTLDDITDIQERIAEAYKEKFDNIQGDFENQISLIEHESATYTNELEQLQSRGYRAGTGYYDILNGVEQKRYDLLKQEYDALQKEYETAIASGEIEYGSEAWYELLTAINDVDEAMQEANSNMIEYTNKARELVWDAFDARQDRINILIDQNEFLMDLIDESNIFDKNGKITQKGVSYIAVGFDSLKKNLRIAKNYGAELEKIREQLERDPYNETLLKREEEVWEKQRQYTLSAKKSADAINDIELKSLKNLIDNYEEVLSKQKNLRDYQKKLKDKTDNVSDIRKQIEALQGDSSESAVKKVQELQKKLRDAEEDVRDMQYDRYIDMQKDMFDELYKEYEETLGRRFDDVNGMVEDMTTGLETKAGEISNTLNTIAKGVGYIIQYEYNRNHIGDVDLNGFITPEDARLAARAGVGLEKLTDQQVENGDIDGDGVVNAADARAIMRFATKIDTIEEYLRALGIVGYSGGGLVSKTGLAMLHGTASDPEVVLNANDSKNLMGLRDAMREMTRMSTLPAGIFNAASASASSAGPSIGEIQINIPIDKVEDYNDFIEKMKADDRFGKLVRAASVDLLTGGSAMRRYQI